MLPFYFKEDFKTHEFKNVKNEIQEFKNDTRTIARNKKKRLNDTGTRTNYNSFKISVKNQEIGLEKQNPQNFATENPKDQARIIQPN